MSKNNANEFSPEVRERAVRLVQESRSEYPSLWLSDESKYMLVSGAVAGGGLTVIANAPNPAGVALLMRGFSDETISIGGLLLWGAVSHCCARWRSALAVSVLRPYAQGARQLAWAFSDRILGSPWVGSFPSSTSGPG